MKNLIAAIGLMSLTSFAHADSKCKIQDATAPFKSQLEKQWFGRTVDFRLVLNGPAENVTSGKYVFIADGGKWAGNVILDLQQCTLTTDGSLVMWKTISDQGNY